MTPDIRLGAPAAPTSGAIVTLFDSTVTFNKAGLRMMGIRRVTLEFPGLDQASAAGGLIGYTSPDKGANWYKATFAPAGDANALPQTVAAQTASDCDSFDIDVQDHDDVKFTLTAGATGPTVWKPVITLLPKRVSGV